jgi:DNA-binding NtrC family response regulator
VNDILFCTQNPLLIKGLYGILRDEGYNVDLSDYPAHAVQQIIKNSYEAIIIDSQAFGMPAEDAVKVIKTIAPDMRVILVGDPEDETDSLSIKVPIDLEKLRNLVHGMHKSIITSHI